MINTMTIDGHRAVIAYDPDIEMFRGEFLGLNGGADFYATTIKGLHKEGATSLRVFLETCAERGVEPFKNYSGKLVARIAPSLHEVAAHVAATQGKSLNDLIVAAIEHEISAAT
jgi:predicted HicB family RNase H-like nuclease